MIEDEDNLIREIVGEELTIEKMVEGDTSSPFTVRSGPELRSRASQVHEARSAKAQATDEAFNAPLAPDLQTWRESPDRFDIEGVDTISDTELARRGEGFLSRAQELDLIDDLERRSPRGRELATFEVENPQIMNRRRRLIRAPESVDEDFAGYTTGPVLAHEVGHAADFDAAFGSEFRSNIMFAQDFSIMGEDRAYDRDVVLEEAKKLSERIRGPIPEDSEYRNNLQELTADVIASMALEPRAARREAPNVFDLVDEQINPGKGRTAESIFDF